MANALAQLLILEPSRLTAVTAAHASRSRRVRSWRRPRPVTLSARQKHRALLAGLENPVLLALAPSTAIAARHSPVLKAADPMALARLVVASARMQESIRTVRRLRESVWMTMSVPAGAHAYLAPVSATDSR